MTIIEIGPRLFIVVLVLIAVTVGYYLLALALTYRKELRSEQTAHDRRPVDKPRATRVVPPNAVPIIREIVAAKYKVSVEQLKGRGQVAPEATARKVAMSLCRELLNMSYPEIGRHFERDHTTVMHAVRTTEGMALGDIREEAKEALGL